jgi:hypothetical protein
VGDGAAERAGASAPAAATLPRTSAAPGSAPRPAPESHARGLDYGLLSLQARPSAVVLLDGRDLGETPIYRRRVSAGWHALELRAPGVPPLKRRVQVPAHGEFQKTYDLGKP